MVQGIVAYLIGTLIIVGLLTWLLGNGHGFDAVAPDTSNSPGREARSDLSTSCL